MTCSGSELRLFISYARKESLKLATDLRKALMAIEGVTVWMDTSELKGGDPWGEIIEAEIQNCDCMVVLVSPDVHNSKSFVRREVSFALSFEKKIIPVIAEITHLPLVLAHLQYIAYAQNRQAGIRWLVSEICQIVHITPPVPPSSRVHITPAPHVPSIILDEDEDTETYPDGTAMLTHDTLLQAPKDTLREAELFPEVSRKTEKPPSSSHFALPSFEWIDICAGRVDLDDASHETPPGSRGGRCKVESFWIAKYPVTNAQYDLFLRDHDDGYVNTDWWNFSPDAKHWRRDHKGSDILELSEETSFKGKDLPRTNVNWYDAVAFCRWLSAHTGETITLPTEAQWQWAARKDTNWAFPWGDRISPDRCNYGGIVRQTTPVTRYEDGASPFGVMDMCGNVWEWCLTEWKTDKTDLKGGSERALRGGSWSDPGPKLRVTYRGARKPSVRSDAIGFRLVRTK